MSVKSIFSSAKKKLSSVFNGGKGHAQDVGSTTLDATKKTIGTTAKTAGKAVKEVAKDPVSAAVIVEAVIDGLSNS